MEITHPAEFWHAIKIGPLGAYRKDQRNRNVMKTSRWHSVLAYSLRRARGSNLKEVRSN